MLFLRKVQKAGKQARWAGKVRALINLLSIPLPLVSCILEDTVIQGILSAEYGSELKILEEELQERGMFFDSMFLSQEFSGNLLAGGGSNIIFSNQQPPPPQQKIRSNSISQQQPPYSPDLRGSFYASASRNLSLVTHTRICTFSLSSNSPSPSSRLLALTMMRTMRYTRLVSKGFNIRYLMLVKACRSPRILSAK